VRPWAWWPAKVAREEEKLANIFCFLQSQTEEK
jgi:hypothetical protein